jgi:O-6-methylguanine DNA methyltransferase
MPAWTLVEGRLGDGLAMRLYLAAHEGRLWSAQLSDDDHPVTPAEFLSHLGSPSAWLRWEHGTGAGLLDAAAMQIGNYFKGRQRVFDLPIEVRGTPFQVRVWSALRKIPYGATQSYGEVAEAIGQPNAVRAVGGANGRNRLPLLIPCHRVVASGGKLGGFTGGVGLKKRLLAHEAGFAALL